MTNLPYDQMHAPVLGPAHPFQKDGVAAGMRNHRAGHIEVSRSYMATATRLCLPCTWDAGLSCAVRAPGCQGYQQPLLGLHIVRCHGDVGVSSGPET